MPRLGSPLVPGSSWQRGGPTVTDARSPTLDPPAVGRLSVEGFDTEKYADHSFRIGAATTDAACGVSGTVSRLWGGMYGSL